MSMSRPGAVPKVPTLPAGDEVAAYSTYLEAQKAVDYLSDNKFPVENVTIVGTDLRMVERVTGRLTYGRVALAGALSGAWFGFFVGLLLTLFAGSSGLQVMFAGIALGAGFGLLFSVLSYSFTGGRRDFTSSSQIVAATYAILCVPEHASDARALLVQSPGGLGKSRGAASAGSAPVYGSRPPAGGPPAPAAPPAPARPADPRWVTPEGEPRYGAMRPGAGGGAGGAGSGGAGSGGAAGSGAAQDGPAGGSAGTGAPTETGAAPAQPTTPDTGPGAPVVPPTSAESPTDPPANPYAPPPTDQR